MNQPFEWHRISALIVAQVFTQDVWIFICLPNGFSQQIVWPPAAGTIS